ncbi:MAG TPA: CHAT domain-containing protein, partial [Myxococcales bacterium]|nr:CHAT domain-containing protein [Myxococcales bacterium]
EAFLDGELPERDAERFGEHLAGCGRCQRELRELVHLDVASARAVDATPEAGKVVSLRLAARRARLPAAAAGLAALAASLVVALQVRELPRARQGEVRVPGQPYLRFQPSRGQGEAPSEPPLLGLAWLKARGDPAAVADAYLVRGQWQAAGPWLDRAGATADALASRAALDLETGRPEEALRDAAEALQRSGDHPAALWNRALALRNLQLPLAAAQAFDQVAALDEPGWADEARAVAARLRDESDRRQRAYADATGRCRAAMRGEQPFPLDVADASGRLARLCFYDVLRSSGTPAALAALEPAAKELDSRFGEGAVLARNVAAARAGASAPRTALSLEYANAVAAGAGADRWLQLAAAARAAGQADLELGALYWVPAARLDLSRYQALAEQTMDPWFATLFVERAAEVDVQRGEPLRALERLRPIEARCLEKSRVNDRCATVERAIAYALVRVHQIRDAKEAGARAVVLARADGDRRVEQNVLEELGQVARFRGDLALAHAYFEEILAREPESCEVSEFVHSELALVHQRVLDFAEARRQVDLAARCAGAPSLKRMFALADLQRSLPGAEDLAVLQRGAEAARAGGTSVANLPLVTHVLGRAQLEHDRAEGERLLRQAIAEADRFQGTDRTPRKARLYSYTSLILDAGRRGDHAAALALFAQERGWASPPPCSVWLAVDDERLLAVAVGEDGRPVGRFDGARAHPVAAGEAVVPAGLLPAVRACPQVQVIARPPLEGRPGLLPPDIAWSEVVRVGAQPEPGHGPQVVVASPAAPAGLGLPALSAPQVPGAVRLEGPDATPSRVLQAARTASLLELHVHGVVDPQVADASYLVLAPEAGGRYSLTARDVRQEALGGHPLVVLAACESGDSAVDLQEGEGLAEAFVKAGARAVLAVDGRIKDPESEQFFRPLLARIQTGATPAAALREA